LPARESSWDNDRINADPATRTSGPAIFSQVQHMDFGALVNACGAENQQCKEETAS
jgi:hypothetical protein